MDFRTFRKIPTIPHYMWLMKVAFYPGFILLFISFYFYSVYTAQWVLKYMLLTDPCALCLRLVLLINESFCENNCCSDMYTNYQIHSFLYIFHMNKCLLIKLCLMLIQGCICSTFHIINIYLWNNLINFYIQGACKL